MGAQLSEPVNAVAIDRTSCQHGAYAVAMAQGLRPKQEDAHINAMPMKVGSVVGTVVGVFDGHGGDQCSACAVTTLPKHLRRTFASSSCSRDLTGAWTSAFKDCDAGLRNLSERDLSGVGQFDREASFSSCGSTAIVACVTPTQKDCFKISVANLGDARCVLVRADGSHSATLDHKPNIPAERDRIHSAGGSVRGESPPRVDGVLAVSRAFGDFEYKDAALPPEEQKVSCCPEVYEWEASSGDCVVLCCDGVFDVIGNDLLSEWILEFTKNQTEVGDMAAKIVTRSLAYGSTDNVSCAILVLGAASRVQRGLECELRPGNLEAVLSSEPGDRQLQGCYIDFLRKTGFEGYVQQKEGRYVVTQAGPWFKVDPASSRANGWRSLLPQGCCFSGLLASLRGAAKCQTP